jgi:ketosteroid isomerase-like protein
VVAVDRSASELIKRLYELFAAGDIPAVCAHMDPDCEWIESEAQGFPGRGRHRGPARIVEAVFEAVPAAFADFALLPERFLEDGESVVVTGHVHGRTRAGARLDAPFAHVFTVRGDRILQLDNYHDTALWLEALSQVPEPQPEQLT